MQAELVKSLSVTWMNISSLINTCAFIINSRQECFFVSGRDIYHLPWDLHKADTVLRNEPSKRMISHFHSCETHWKNAWTMEEYLLMEAPLSELDQKRPLVKGSVVKCCMPESQSWVTLSFPSGFFLSGKENLNPHRNAYQKA